MGRVTNEQILEEIRKVKKEISNVKKELEELWGDMNRRLGHLLELFFAKFRDKIKIYDKQFKLFIPNFVIYEFDKASGEKRKIVEFDLVYKNKNQALIVELKTTLNEDTFKETINKITKLNKYLKTHKGIIYKKTDKTLSGSIDDLLQFDELMFMVAAIYFEEEYKQKAESKGIGLMYLTTGQIINSKVKVYKISKQ